MGYEDFWEMTPREFWNASKGHTDKVEREYRASWEQARWVGTQAANAFSKNPLPPKRRLPFPWDNESKGIDWDEEKKKIKEYRDALNNS